MRTNGQMKGRKKSTGSTSGLTRLGFSALLCACWPGSVGPRLPQVEPTLDLAFSSRSEPLPGRSAFGRLAP